MCDSKELIRALTPLDAIAMVVGGVIGTGVFLQSAVMAQHLGRAEFVLAAWAAAGVLSLLGALTYAELGALFPETGGDYVYLHKAYGETPAFLWGWMNVAVASPGAIAGISMAFAVFLASALPLGGAWIEQTFTVVGHRVHWQFGYQQLVSVAAIIVLSAINCLGVGIGGRLQSILTATKLVGIGVLILGAFSFSPPTAWAAFNLPSASPPPSLRSFGAAIFVALWAYDGWFVLPMVAGEVRNPERNVPRALVIGMLGVTATYLVTNLSYCYCLSFDDIVTSHSADYPDALPVAAKAVETSFGSFGLKIVSIIFVVSTLGALNQIILGTARIPYAMSRDGLFFSILGKISARHVPASAIWFQAAIAIGMALLGSFEQLVTCTVFALWVFYAATGTAVFVIRKKSFGVLHPHPTRGYPFVPLLFVLTAYLLVINIVFTKPLEAAVGIVVITTGVPVYLVFKRCRPYRLLS